MGKNLIINIIKYFELNFGWFFVNGRKKESWCKYIQKKYGNV
jgi:hypothetical protein